MQPLGLTASTCFRGSPKEESHVTVIISPAFLATSSPANLPLSNYDRTAHHHPKAGKGWT